MKYFCCLKHLSLFLKPTSLIVPIKGNFYANTPLSDYMVSLKEFVPLLMNIPSFLISPMTPSFATASEPAKSTSRILE